MRIVVLLVGALFCLAMQNCSYSKHLARSEAKTVLNRMRRPAVPDTIRLSDLDRVPVPVRSYLIKTGVVGHEQVRTFRAKFTGKFRMKEGGSWLPINVIQYSFLDSNFTRIFYIEGTMWHIFPVKGRDKYMDGKGNMVIRPLELFTAVNQTGEAMDRSALVTFLNDMLMFPMAMLNSKVNWEAITDSSARATLSDCGHTVSGIFYFNKEHDLIDFETSDRTYDDGRGDIRKAKWWTPLNKHHEINGLRIPGEGQAVWDFGDHSFPYASFKIQDVGYNLYQLYDQ